MFKRMMILGAVASALALTGCQSRSQQDQPAATGGSGIGGQNYEGGSGGSGSVGSPENVDGMGRIGGSTGDQGTVGADGLDGTDDRALDEQNIQDDAAGDTGNQGSESR